MGKVEPLEQQYLLRARDDPRVLARHHDLSRAVALLPKLHGAAACGRIDRGLIRTSDSIGVELARFGVEVIEQAQHHVAPKIG